MTALFGWTTRREFIIELQTTFGPHNLVADAEHELDHLQMKKSQHINKYEDEICHTGKPQTLGELHLLAQEVDAQYWEHKEEAQCQTKSIASTSKQANPRNNS
ncbi:hypothetical protein ID866_13089, partial [Astraeus odoratus]